MQCPTCNDAMRTIDRGGILMDTCQKCGGVWLDPREAAKIVNLLSVQTLPHRDPRYRDQYDSDDNYDRRDDFRGHRSDHDSDDGYHGHGRHGRKRGLRGLLDLFD